MDAKGSLRLLFVPGFLPAWWCVSMQPAFRSKTWNCLSVSKAQREVSSPAPLNPNRLLSA